MIAAACTISLLVFSGGQHGPELNEVPTQRNLIQRVEPYTERVGALGKTIRGKVIFKPFKVRGQQILEPMYILQSPDTVRRLRCDPIVGE